MKKFNYLLLVVISIFISCDKNEFINEEKNVNYKEIVRVYTEDRSSWIEVTLSSQDYQQVKDNKSLYENSYLQINYYSKDEFESEIKFNTYNLTTNNEKINGNETPNNNTYPIFIKYKFSENLLNNENFVSYAFIPKVNVKNTPIVGRSGWGFVILDDDVDIYSVGCINSTYYQFNNTVRNDCFVGLLEEEPKNIYGERSYLDSHLYTKLGEASYLFKPDNRKIGCIEYYTLIGRIGPVHQDYPANILMILYSLPVNK